MRADLISALTDWLLTYWVHATVLLAAAAALARLRVLSFAARDLLWKCALVGPLFSATAHSLVVSLPSERLSVAPMVAAAADPAPVAVERAVVGADAARSVGAPLIGTPRDWRGEFLVAWAGIAAVLLFGLAARRARLMHRIGRRRQVGDAQLRDLLETLCLAAGYPHYVRLTAAPGLASPVALPGREICLPEAVVTELGREQQRGVLAHELAHVVRRDPLWLGVAQVMERLFFLQPLNWLARRELQVTAEYVCDDWAAHQVGSGLPLARCLLTVAEWIAGATGPLPEPAMASRGSHLMRRVERLVRGDGIRADHGRRIGFALGALMVAATMVAAPAVTAGVPATRLAPVKHLSAGKHERQSSDSSRAARVAALVAALKDSDPGVRAAAAQALGRLDDKSAGNALAELLRDPDPEVQEQAIMALAELEDPRAVPGLEKLLTSGDAEVRQEAANRLGNVDLATAPAALINALKDPNSEVRQAAANSLGNIDDQKAVPALVPLLNDPDKDVQEATVNALHNIGGPAAMQALIGALKSKDPQVRRMAAEALGDRD
ncbi:MAG: putative rane protein [Gemmatimonadetes bacterium]|nr:putative rane protein [Gemmatimonadota bacterium]